LNHITKFPPALPFVCLVFVYTTTFVLKKYHFTSHDLAKNIDEIINHIHQVIFLLDNKGNIIKTNIYSELINLNKDNSVYGNNFSEIINTNKEFFRLKNSLANGKTYEFVYQTFLKIPGQKRVIAKCRFKRITNKMNDFIGSLVIAKMNYGLKTMFNQNKISERQADIIFLTTCGIPNTEIAEALEISKRTVESHLISIYSKFSINNKNDLIKLISGY